MIEHNVYVQKGLYTNCVVVPNVFSKEEIQEIKRLGRNLQLIRGGVGMDSGETVVKEDARSSTIGFFTHTPETHFIFHRILNTALNVNRDYYGFDLQGVQPPQYTEYNKKDHYAFHMDIVDQIPLICRKLSATIALSDPSEYTGGELQFLVGGDTPADNFAPGSEQLGSMTFFPSYLMHRVSPVESGTRCSLVSWFIGPGLK